MVREFTILVVLLLVSLAVILSHYLLYERSDRDNKSLAIARVIKHSAPSLSVAYYEPRVLYTEPATNPAYPQMQSIDKMDFVYAK